MTPEIIDDIPCYAPELAFDNTGYHPDALSVLTKLEIGNFWYVSRNKVLKYLFGKYLKGKKSDVLEVGCGNGIVLGALSELNNLHLTGADIYLSGIKNAQLNAPKADFIQINAESIPFENKFDAVGCFDVLEHIENDVKVISQLTKALKTNGTLFITVPQYPWLWSEIDEIDRHKRRYTKKEIVDKIKNAGMDVLYVNSFVFALFPVVLASRIGRKRKIEEVKITDAKVRYPEMEISPLINSLLRAVMYIDEVLISLGIKLPFGSSLIIVAKKK
jgi:SAM-dependent methyltransferase